MVGTVTRSKLPRDYPFARQRSGTFYDLDLLAACSVAYRARSEAAEGSRSGIAIKPRNWRSGLMNVPRRKPR
jgi:hypothetical protein